MSTVPCPECNRVLRSAKGFRPGQRLRCPACEAVFNVPRAAAPIEERPRRSPFDSLDRDQDRDQDRPRMRRCYEDEQDDRSRRRPRDDHDDDYDDRPRRRGRQGGKRGLVLLLSGLTVLLLGGIFVVTAFVWPGFLRSAPAGSELLAFAPADADFVMGVNLAQLRDQPEYYKQQMETAIKALKDQGAPGEIEDIIRTADRAMLAGKFSGNTFSMVAAIQTTEPYDQDKLKKLLEVDKPETLKGKSVYRKSLPGPKAPPLFVSMNDPKILLIGIMPEDDFGSVLENQGKAPKLPPELIARAAQLEKSYLWLVVANQGKLKEQLMQAPPLPKAPPAVQSLVPIAQRAKMLSLAFDLLPSKDFRVTLTLECGNDADSQELKKIADGLVALLGLFLGPDLPNIPPAMKELVNDFNKSFKAEQRGLDVTLSLQITEKTYKQLEQWGKDMQGPVGRVREAAARTQSMNNLRQIGFALLGYHGAHKRLPGNIAGKDGRPLLSWRVAILPYIEGKALYDQFDLGSSWDSPQNRRLISMMPHVYAAPGQPRERGLTFYRGFTGPLTPFEQRPDGVRLRDFLDGESNTILAVEANTPVEWTRPDDIPFNPQGPPPALNGGVFPNGFHALFGDATVRFIRIPYDPAALRGAITRNGGENAPRLE